MTAFKTWVYIFTCTICSEQWRHEYAYKPDKEKRYQLLNNYVCEGCE